MLGRALAPVNTRVEEDALILIARLLLLAVGLARPTGLGHALTTETVAIPLEGRAEWLAAAGVKSA